MFVADREDAMGVTVLHSLNVRGGTKISRKCTLPPWLFYRGSNRNEGHHFLSYQTGYLILRDIHMCDIADSNNGRPSQQPGGNASDVW